MRRHLMQDNQTIRIAFFHPKVAPMIARTRKRLHHRREGNVVVLTMFLLVGMIALLAFSLDLGYIYTARVELQRSADAAALAGTWRLLEKQLETLGEIEPSTATLHARDEAERFAAANRIGSVSPELTTDDVLVGHYQFDEEGAVVADPDLIYNSVQVHVQRTDEVNGEVPLFFARLLGVDRLGLRSQARAAFWSNFSGFQAPSDGSDLGILPIALDENTFNSGILNNGGSDNYRWNEETQTISSGADGVPEVNLYPQGTGSPGNRGTVDIGSSNNSTSDLARQILHGISDSDLEYHGGKLEFDEDGELSLNGDTGISAAIKAQLETIKGEPRVIPIFESVAGNGNNANYVITQFAGVRIMYVQLTGAMKNKRVIVQPAAMQIRGGIHTDGDPKVHYVFSPVVLVR